MASKNHKLRERVLVGYLLLTITSPMVWSGVKSYQLFDQKKSHYEVRSEIKSRCGDTYFASDICYFFASPGVNIGNIAKQTVDYVSKKVNHYRP